MGVSPPPLRLPQMRYPGTGITSLSHKRRGGMGGQALSPPLPYKYFSIIS
jgi:hypothetical protein